MGFDDEEEEEGVSALMRACVTCAAVSTHEGLTFENYYLFTIMKEEEEKNYGV